MKTTFVSLSKNPRYRTVTGLTNTSFDAASIVSGRGATEDQLKTIHDQCAELETQVAEIENSDTLNAIVAEMRAEVDDLRAMVEHCCSNLHAGVVDEPSGTGDGADVSVGVAWDADPQTNGGQMTATSSSGAAIVMYWFLVRKSDGVFLKMPSARFAGRVLTVDTATGAITVTAGSGAATDKIVAGATDENGCEGLRTYSATSAPWYVPGG